MRRTGAVRGQTVTTLNAVDLLYRRKKSIDLVLVVLVAGNIQGQYHQD